MEAITEGVEDNEGISLVFYNFFPLCKNIIQINFIFVHFIDV